MKYGKRQIIIVLLMIILFIVLSLRLFYLQILNKDKYIKLLDSITINEVYSTSTPRGRIYDRNYNLLVDNVGVKTIYYKRKLNTTIKDEIDLAYKLAGVIDLDYKNINRINLKEFYLNIHRNKLNKRVTNREKNLLKKRKYYQKI